MYSAEDYTKLTLEELMLEEKKMKSQKITAAMFVGLLVGIAVWSATHRGGALTYFLLFFSFLIGARYSNKLKGIQAEIGRRDTVR